jgi:hypothetical protein
MARYSNSTLPLTFFKEKAARMADGRRLNPRQRLQLLEDALDACGLPHPAPEIKSFFTHPNILHDLLTSIYNRLPDLHNIGDEYSPYLSALLRVVGKYQRSEARSHLKIVCA